MRTTITHLVPRKSLARWFAFGMLCAIIGVACLVERFPLLPV
jgi:hypothetical protein